MRTSSLLLAFFAGATPTATPRGVLDAVSAPATASFSGTVVSSGLQLDIDLETAPAITLSTTMRASGSAPPVVLLAAGTGSLTFAGAVCPGFFVDILAGATTFNLSFDSGATVAFAAQTIPVGGGNYTIPSGTYAGMIITFPSGTYNADQSYEGTVQTLLSSEGDSRSFTQATTARQPVFRHRAVAPDGKNALWHAGGGAGQFLVCTTAAVVASFVNDPPLTIFGRIAYTAADASGTWFAAARSDTNNTNQRYFGQDGTGNGREIHVVINATPTTIVNLCTTNPLTGGTAAHTVCYFFPGSNGGANIEVNGAGQSFVSSALNIGTNTPNCVAIGSIPDTAPSVPMAGYIYRIVVFNTQLSEAARDAWFADIAA